MLLDKRLPIKFILRKIRFELFTVSIYAFGVAFLDEYLHLQRMSVPLSLPGLLGTAISLILGFRIAQSYDRWWEARKIWGAIVNDSRSLVRQVLTHTTGTGEEKQVYASRTANLQIAWCYALGESLRDKSTLENKEEFLSPKDLDFLRTQSNVPNGILTLHSNELRNQVDNERISAFHSMLIDNTIVRLTDAMGKSERIKKTIFPRTYTLIVEFLLYLFVLMLPFGIIEFFGYLEAPIVILIALPFFFLEKTALHLQDPFSNMPTDTPVTTIAQGIEVNLKQMVGDDLREIVIDDHNSYYLM